MDILNLIKDNDRIRYAESYAYPTSFMGQKLFPAVKTENLKVSAMRVVEGGTLPVMAMVHSLDSEARIAERTNFEEINFEQFLIKEKINQTERIIKYLGHKASDNEVKAFVYDDFNLVMSDVLTRIEVANMELLSTGKISIKENNVTKELDYRLPINNKISFANWSDPDHDIIGDIRTIKKNAKAMGVTLARAITSEKVLGYITSNNAVKSMWEKKTDIMTDEAVLTWLSQQFGIEFVTNDEVYKTGRLSGETKRFFKEDTISFLDTRGTLGQGFYGVTPEELELNDGKYSFNQKMMVALTQWKHPDPVAVWTKASALYVPVLKNVNGLFIATVS